MKIWTKSCEKIGYQIDPMRLLLISDTHGKLGAINELSSIVQADAVIHAGDFGFYDDESFERLSDRELRLHVTHSRSAACRKRQSPDSVSF